MNKRFLWYPAIIGVFATLIWVILQKGQSLPANPHNIIPAAPVAAAGHTGSWWRYLDNLKHPLGLLLLQIIVIMLVARLFGVLANKLRQPAVVGEIIAGVLLGPSLLGWTMPAFSGFLFPAESLKNLQFLSQIGLAFFMFIVGMELDINKIRHKAHDA